MLTKPALWYYGHLSPFIPQYHNLLMKYLNSMGMGYCETSSVEKHNLVI